MAAKPTMNKSCGSFCSTLVNVVGEMVDGVMAVGEAEGSTVGDVLGKAVG